MTLHTAHLSPEALAALDSDEIAYFENLEECGFDYEDDEESEFEDFDN